MRMVSVPRPPSMAPTTAAAIMDTPTGHFNAKHPTMNTPSMSTNVITYGVMFLLLLPLTQGMTLLQVVFTDRTGT